MTSDRTSTAEHAASPHVRFVDHELFGAVGNGKFRQLLNDAGTGGKSIVYLTKCPPQGGVDSPAHEHEGEQLFYILSGEMTFDIAGERCVAGEESLVVIPPGSSHKNWNVGPEESVFLNITALSV